MLRVCWRGANAAARKCLCGNGAAQPMQSCRRYTSAGDSGSVAGKIVAASLLTVGGGVGGTILYAKWDPKFRAAVEKGVPYSDQLFEMTIGPPPPPPVIPLPKKPVKVEPLQISSVSEASKDSKQPQQMKEKKVAKEEKPPVQQEAPPLPQTIEAEECKECEHEAHAHVVKERPEEVVSARLAAQDRAEHDLLSSLSAKLDDTLGSSAKLTLQAIGAQEAALSAIANHTSKLKEAMDAEGPSDKTSAQWRSLEDALNERSRAADEAGAALLKAKEELEKLRKVINAAKDSKIDAARPQILAAEENLHSMVVDLDRAVGKVQTAQMEAKIVSQYSELVNEAKAQFQKELDSITPEIQANWKGLTGKLSPDDLNSLIAHAHRRIDQLNRELAEQRVREQIHIEAALDQQRLENQKTLDKAVGTAISHSREQMRLEQEKKIEDVREVMEAEMRTQLRRQAAAHTDHLRDVLKVQEQELRAEAQEVLSSKLMEQETNYRRVTQDQLDAFTLDMNAAYARLKGIEEAIDSHVVAEEEARKAHQLWLSVEALTYSLKTAVADSPTEPLETAAKAVRESCADNEFAVALASALPEESLSRGIYSEASLRARFYQIRGLVRRVAMINETRNSLYQYFLSYLQSVLLFEPEQLAPPTKLKPEDLDTFKLLSYATYSIERGDLELAAKFINQLTGEPRRVAQDWLKEARLTLETRQVVNLLSAYANAVGLGTTQAP
ncbi:MICOS complex subunit MIC60 isoform X4 [Denticeps clupeoides]|uniref:MICOS complex subunit MIC60 n=1 Tax=Denticeps clupeoides TaxID=299321 RepID=A0AAY4BWF8_9TELE|nr:MICOS complex subunit MIC60 isoform X4 [Denticeps clupeoides]